MTVDDRRNILSQALLGTTDANRQEWLAERRSGIGGSEAAAVLGISPWATPVTVWLDKTGRSAPKPSTLRMAFGSINEEDVAMMYEIQTGRKVQRYNRMIHRGCLLGNFDRLVVREGEKVASHMGTIRTDTLLECKCSDRSWDDGVPLYYQTQVQHYMGLSETLAHADVACYFRMKNTFEVFRVERDEDVIGTMRERLTAWWNEYVVGDKMPPPTNEADCKLLWARSNPGKTVTASDEVAAKLADYRRFKADEKTAKEAVGRLQSDIEAYLGDAEILVDTVGKPLVTWKSAKDSRKTDWESLARALGATDAQIADYTTSTPGPRRFVAK